MTSAKGAQTFKMLMGGEPNGLKELRGYTTAQTILTRKRPVAT